MAAKSVAMILFFLSFLSYIANAQQHATFDIINYGAKPNADVSKALLSAWKEACASNTPAKIIIPSGTWPLVQVKLIGPNKSPIELIVKGTLTASSDPHQLPDKKADWMTIMYVDNFEISGGGVFDGQGQQAWKMNNCNKNINCVKLPMNLFLGFIKNTYIHDVTTKDSKNFHVNCLSSHNVRFERFIVSAPGNSPNTDGIHIARSTNITVIHSDIKTGDDCISIGDESTDIHIEKVTCGPGHGISVGSLGLYTNEKDVKGIYVKHCTFIGSTNGVRVKSWPSGPSHISVSELYFEDLTMQNVGNPVIIDQQYCPNNLCNLAKPSAVKISNVFIKNIRGTSSTQEAVILNCSKAYPCENVHVEDVDLKYIGNAGPTTTKCMNAKPTLVGKQFPAISC